MIEPSHTTRSTARPPRSRKPTARAVATWLGFALVAYLGTVGVYFLLGRTGTDAWVHGIIGLGPYTGVMLAGYWRRRRSDTSP